MPSVFPIIIIALSAWASVVHFVCREPVHGAYWFFAAALNTCVLFMRDV